MRSRWMVIGFYGVLIGLLLAASTWLMLWLWPVRRFEWFAGLIAGLFLLAGLGAGVRLKSAGGESRSSRAVDDEMAEPADGSAGPTGLPEALTEREREILCSLAAGSSNAEIAERYFISVNTVKAHLRQVYAKLGVGRRLQAVARARELGLLEPMAGKLSENHPNG